MKNQTDTMPAVLKKRRIVRFYSQGYPAYPVDDVIYNKFREEKQNNPDVIIKNKYLNENEKIKAFRSKYILDEMCGNYLDMPKGELDD